jgi:hypothetical protein
MELVDSAKKPFVRVNNQSAVAKALAGHSVSQDRAAGAGETGGGVFYLIILTFQMLRKML